nr:hypothetical protein [Tanacetum cinerariifolium]
MMDNPNITKEEYIRLEEEKAHRHGKVYNWQTTKYGKIWYEEDVHDLRSVETEFPAIVFNDKLASEEAFPCKPMVSPLSDNKIDFRILFEESDDEDYTIFIFYPLCRLAILCHHPHAHDLESLLIISHSTYALSFDRFDKNVSFEEEVIDQRLRKTLTHVLELSLCVYLDDRAWGVLNFDSAGVRDNA